MSWLDKFFKAYSSVQVGGVALAPETTINFVGATVVDDPTNARTTVTVTGGGGGTVPTGTGIPHIVGGVQQAAASLIVNADVDPAAAIALSKLASGTAGDLLIYSGGAWNRLPIAPADGYFLKSLSGLPAWVAPTFDPASLNLTGYWKDFASAPWAGSSSAGPSGGRGLSTGTAPVVGASFGTHPSASFNGTSMSLTSSTLTLDSYFTTKAVTGSPSLTFAAAGNTVTRSTGSFVTDGFVVGDTVSISGSVSNNTNGRALTGVTATVLTFASGVVNETVAAAIVVSSYFVQVDFQATAASAAGAAGYNDAPLFADNQGNFYLTFTSSGVRAGHYDGSFKVTSFVACSTGVKHCAQMWHDGSTVSMRVDGGAAVTVAAGAMSGQSGCYPRIGANFNATSFFTGLEGRILVANNPLTPTIRDQLRTDSQANFGTI